MEQNLSARTHYASAILHSVQLRSQTIEYAFRIDSERDIPVGICQVFDWRGFCDDTSHVDGTIEFPVFANSGSDP